MITEDKLIDGKRYQGFWRKGETQEFALATWDAKIGMFIDVHRWRDNESLPITAHHSQNKPMSFEPATGVGDWVR